MRAFHRVMYVALIALTVAAPLVVQAQAPLAPLPNAREIPVVPAIPPVVTPERASPGLPRVREIQPAVVPVSVQSAARIFALDVNKSRMVRLSRPARDVLVANPAVADIVLRSPDTAFIIGRKVGETNVYFFDADGRQIDEIDVHVAFDSASVMAAIKRMIPNEQIEVSTANQSLMLSGSVANPQVAENVRQIARR
jgi:pilus assembly protein CpaC